MSRASRLKAVAKRKRRKKGNAPKPLSKRKHGLPPDAPGSAVAR